MTSQRADTPAAVLPTLMNTCLFGTIAQKKKKSLLKLPWL